MIGDTHLGDVVGPKAISRWGSSAVNLQWMSRLTIKLLCNNVPSPSAFGLEYGSWIWKIFAHLHFWSSWVSWVRWHFLDCLRLCNGKMSQWILIEQLSLGRWNQAFHHIILLGFLDVRHNAYEAIGDAHHIVSHSSMSSNIGRSWERFQTASHMAGT